jgi:hypothetical protein
MSRKIFVEFIEFSPKCLNFFKIQIRFKLVLLLNFIIQNPEGFGSWDKKKICSILIDLPLCQPGDFQISRKLCFLISKLEQLN